MSLGSSVALMLDVGLGGANAPAPISVGPWWTVLLFDQGEILRSNSVLRVASSVRGLPAVRRNDSLYCSCARMSDMIASCRS